MNLRALKCIPLTMTIAVVILLFSHPAGAQQVTYYSFDNAVTSGSYGSCELPNGSANPLLCLNGKVVQGYSGAGQNTFPTTIYPYYLIPGENESSVHNELMLNGQQAGNGESVWFSRAQKVKNGFTNYFAFRVVPPAESTSVGDGLAFVIQNAQGSDGADPASGCNPTGSSVVALGDNGGCLGYGGMDNSLAIEFDTSHNSYDPSGDANTTYSSANHISVQSCGTSQNTSSHTSGCQIAVNNDLPFSIADGQIHQVVVEYSGAPTNLLQVYVDPPFVPGTFTPCNGEASCDSVVATPVISVAYDITHLNLITSADGPDSAYVGFTAATGSFSETNEILEWTYTPHTTTTQQQQINNNGMATTFPFGNHTYAVTYPAGTAGTSTDMIVDANTISPSDFSTLIAGTPFSTSSCQLYEGTGGNCIIYSVYCVTHATTTKVPCPATSDPVIAVKSAYDSDDSVPPPAPGFLQGDPLYSQIATIQGNGTTATVNCTGECAVTDGEHVSIRNSSEPSLDAENVVASVPDPSVVDSFTYPSTSNASGTGGFVTSGNLQDICNPPGDPVPCWQAQRIDPTTSGKTKNFSDLVALFQTVNTVATTTSINAPAILYGNPAQITVSVSPNTGSGPVTGNVTLTVDGTPLAPQALSAGLTVFNVSGLSGGPHSLSASYAGNSPFQPSSTTGTLTVTATPLAQITPPSIDFGTVYVLSITTRTVTITNAGDAPMTITGPFVSILGGGNSKEFVSVNLCPKSLAAGKSCVMTVSFLAGPVYTPRTAVLTINDNAPGSPQTVMLTATVINPQAALSTTSLSFGNQKTGTPSAAKMVTLKNTGATTLAINSITVTGGNAGDFSRSATTCGSSLTAGNSCTISITFTPSAKGSRSSTLVINDNARFSPQVVVLSGKGT
jgi:hypothetical protein